MARPDLIVGLEEGAKIGGARLTMAILHPKLPRRVPIRRNLRYLAG